MLQEDDCVGRSQVEAQSAHVRGQQHDLYGGVAVETLHEGKPLGCLDTAGRECVTEWRGRRAAAPELSEESLLL